MSFNLRHYPRSTRNFYYCVQDGLTVWYSYRTAVAVEVNGERYVTFIDSDGIQSNEHEVGSPMFAQLANQLNMSFNVTDLQ